jgi:hypothetical protein
VRFPFWDVTSPIGEVCWLRAECLVLLKKHSTQGLTETPALYQVGNSEKVSLGARVCLETAGVMKAQ